MGRRRVKITLFLLNKIMWIIDPIEGLKDSVTLGITALFSWRVHIDKKVCDLDVGSKIR